MKIRCLDGQSQTSFDYRVYRDAGNNYFVAEKFVRSFLIPWNWRLYGRESMLGE